MEALYTEKEFNLEGGLLVPKTNIATLAHSALVIEGVCRSRYIYLLYNLLKTSLVRKCSRI